MDQAETIHFWNVRGGPGTWQCDNCAAALELQGDKIVNVTAEHSQ
jgi:hypothetical protein